MIIFVNTHDLQQGPEAHPGKDLSTGTRGTCHPSKDMKITLFPFIQGSQSIISL